MQKNILILFYIFIFSNSTLAQNDNSGRTKIVKWPKYYKASIPDQAPAVANIQVIPFLWDVDHLGYAQVGLDNKNVSAVPQEPFPSFIQDYITKRYGGENFKPNCLHLLWIVKDLRINERTQFSAEHAFVRLKADSYASVDGNTYHFVTSFDTVLRRSGMDVTSRHSQNMAEAFHLLLKQSLQLVPVAMANASATDLNVQENVQEIEDQERLRFAVPILTDSSYKEGVYTSFDEFLKNNPSIPTFDIALEGKNIKLYKLNGTESEEISSAWGFCQGGEIFKYHRGVMIPIERAGNGFVISTYLENSNRRNKDIFLSGMLGGAIGAAASSSPSSKKIYTVTAIPYITKKQPEACAIDMETGELTF